MYKTVYREGESRLVEKKSEFIARVTSVETKEAAEAFIAQIRSRDKDATHHCSAYIIHEDRSVQKYDDDGEPQKTAGPPILEVLKRNELTNVVCVVTRYFGGTLLGAGGLIRAYSTAASEAVKEGLVVEMMETTDMDFQYDYGDHGAIENHMIQHGYPVMDTIYGERVSVTTTMYRSGREAFITYLNDATSGRVDILREEETMRPRHEGALLYKGKRYLLKD